MSKKHTFKAIIQNASEANGDGTSPAHHPERETRQNRIKKTIQMLKAGKKTVQTFQL